MNLKESPQMLCFDDILLVPQFSDIKSRYSGEIDLSCKINNLAMGSSIYSLLLKVPILVAPMDSFGITMANSIRELGGLAVVHRYNTIQKQLEIATKINEAVYAVGATGDYIERVDELYKLGHHAFCIDVAHGDSQSVIEAIKNIKKKYSNSIVIAGNVATGAAAARLGFAGADVIRAGVGGGGQCTTRIVSGHGFPTFETICSIKKVFDEKYGKYRHLQPRPLIMADGGIRGSGDIVKSLAAGADLVMMGTAFAGTDESEGKTTYDALGNKFKEFRGMASREAMDEWTVGKSHVTPEGVTSKAKYSGSLKSVVDNLIGGVLSGFSYSGARNISELQENALFVRVSPMGFKEGTPHGSQ